MSRDSVERAIVVWPSQRPADRFWANVVCFTFAHFFVFALLFFMTMIGHRGSGEPRPALPSDRVVEVLFGVASLPIWALLRWPGVGGLGLHTLFFAAANSLIWGACAALFAQWLAKARRVR